MAQFLNPTSDLHVGAWRTQTGASTNLWDTIADATPDEADYISSETSPNNSPYVCALGSVTDPAVSTGHTVSWRHRNPESGTLNLTVELRQGYASEASQGTLIATWTESALPGTFTTVTHTLTGGEADAITNYGTLALRFVADEA